MGISFILLVVTMVSLITGSFERVIGKRSTMGDDTANNIDYPDYSPKYELYPVVPKRAALLFDQLMVALQKAVNNQGKDLSGSKSVSKSLVNRFPVGNSKIIPMMDLQRRGLDKSDFYWRCLVNALACYKKK